MVVGLSMPLDYPTKTNIRRYLALNKIPIGSLFDRVHFFRRVYRWKNSHLLRELLFHYRCSTYSRPDSIPDQVLFYDPGVKVFFDNEICHLYFWIPHFSLYKSKDGPVPLNTRASVSVSHHPH